MPAPNDYFPPMKLLAGLLLTVLLAAFAGSAAMSGAAPAPHWDGQHQVMMMADCEDCTSEQMQAAQPCGSICVSPGIAVSGAQEFQPVWTSAGHFIPEREKSAGQIQRPEPNPPRLS